MNRNVFLRKFLLRAITTKVSLIPIVGGLCVLCCMWTFGFDSIGVTLAAIIAIVAGFIIAVARILLRGSSLAKDVRREIEQEAERTREAQLDNLVYELRRDDNHRACEMLGELRALMKAFCEDQANTEDQGNASIVLSNLAIDGGRLTSNCIKTLEQWHARNQRRTGVRSVELQRVLTQQQERGLEEISSTIKQLRVIRARIEESSIGDDPSMALRELRAEVDTSLRIAEEVNRVIDGTDNEPSDEKRGTID